MKNYNRFSFGISLQLQNSWRPRRSYSFRQLIPFCDVHCARKSLFSDNVHLTTKDSYITARTISEWTYAFDKNMKRIVLTWTEIKGLNFTGHNNPLAVCPFANITGKVSSKGSKLNSQLLYPFPHPAEFHLVHSQRIFIRPPPMMFIEMTSLYIGGDVRYGESIREPACPGVHCSNTSTEKKGLRQGSRNICKVTPPGRGTRAPLRAVPRSVDTYNYIRRRNRQEGAILNFRSEKSCAYVSDPSEEAYGLWLAPRQCLILV